MTNEVASLTFKEKTYDFLSEPTTMAGRAFKAFIALLIFTTATLVFISYFYP